MPTSRRVASAGILLGSLTLLVILAIGWGLWSARPVARQQPERAPRTRWSQAATLSTPRDDFGLTVVEGRLYVLGGMTGDRGNKLDSTEIYDPAADRWTPGPALTVGRSSFRAATLGGTIYVFGGSTDDQATVDLVEALDTATGRWKGLAPLPAPRFGHAVVELGGQIYAIGGYQGGRGIATVDVYDPAGDRWTAAPPLPTPRYNLTAVVFAGKIYALGGWVNDGPSTVVEVYDPATGSWTAGPPLLAPMSNFGAAVFDGRIHALYHSTHQVLDGAANRWTTANPMPTTRHGQGVIAVGERLYAIGGCYEDPQYDLNVTEVLVPGPVSTSAAPVSFRPPGVTLTLALGAGGGFVPLVDNRYRWHVQYSQ